MALYLAYNADDPTFLAAADLSTERGYQINKSVPFIHLLMRIGNQATAALRRLKLRANLAKQLRHEPDSVLADAGWDRRSLEGELNKPCWRA